MYKTIKEIRLFDDCTGTFMSRYIMYIWLSCTSGLQARDSRANPNQCGGRCFVRKFSRQITRVFNNVNGQSLRCQGSIYLYRCEGLCPSNLYIHPLSLALVRTAQCCVPLSQTLQARQRVSFNCHTLYGYPVARTAFANVFRPRRCACRRC